MVHAGRHLSASFVGLEIESQMASCYTLVKTDW